MITKLTFSVCIFYRGSTWYVRTPKVWSNCIYAQADMSFYTPHILENIFLLGVPQKRAKKQNKTKSQSLCCRMSKLFLRNLKYTCGFIMHTAQNIKSYSETEKKSWLPAIYLTLCILDPRDYVTSLCKCMGISSNSGIITFIANASNALFSSFPTFILIFGWGFTRK